MNYFSLIDEIKQVSLRYAEEFYEGDIYEYLNSGNHKYPSIILTVQNITTDEDVSTISATIFAVDRLTNDSSNKLEVQSLCMSKITQILGTLEERVNNLQSNTLVPFTEKFSDLCGGMYGEFTLDYIGEGVCDLGLQIKEIELTRNGVYDIMGYDKAIVNIKLQELSVTSNGEYIPSDYDVEGFSKVTVDVESSLQDLTVTSNGEYIPSDYDVDGFSKVTVDVEPLLQDLTVTEDGDYLPSDYGVEGFGKVTAKFDTSSLPKVKVTNLSISGNSSSTAAPDSCINAEGRWEGENLVDFSNLTAINNLFYYINALKYLDVSTWDTSNIKGISYFCYQAPELLEIKGVEDLDTSSLTTIQYTFFTDSQVHTLNLDLRKWNTSNLTTIRDFCRGNIRLNIEGWDTSNVTYFDNILTDNDNPTWANLVGISAANATRFNNVCTSKVLTTIVGDYTINDVINNDLKVFDGIKISFSLSGATKLLRPSLRAVINGLADLTGQTSQQLKLAVTAKGRITNADVAVATSKNWTIA